MPYILDGSIIRAPMSFDESNSTQFAQNRTLDGTKSRDYFGSNKRVWTLEYSNVKKADYDTIKTIYDDYLASVDTKSWQVTEDNYTVSLTQVHLDLVERAFSVGGESYISDFALILTEA